MSLATVDKARCDRDLACAAVCPFGIIQPDKEGYPRSRRALEHMCIRCGHCVAVCPTGALTTGDMTASSCEAAGKVADADDFIRTMKARRSIREFGAEPVERSLIERALDSTRWAATGKNAQPCQWIIVESPDKLRELAKLSVDWIRASGVFPGIPEAWDMGIDLVLRKAPCLAIVHAGKDAIVPEADCVIAVTHLDLALSALGLGACWAGFFMAAAKYHAPVTQALELPEGNKVYGALMIGKPKYVYPRIPPREPIKARWV